MVQPAAWQENENIPTKNPQYNATFQARHANPAIGDKAIMPPFCLPPLATPGLMNERYGRCISADPSHEEPPPEIAQHFPVARYIAAPSYFP
jgi:hypothetical protein